MSETPHLLPNNGTTTTPEQKALSIVLAPRLPVEIVAATKPATAPPAFLPFLAQHESVDLWFEDWDEDRKRAMIADAPGLAKVKGTRAAAARFLAYVDAAIVDKVSHPARHPIGRIAAGIHPIQHRPQVARFLLKVALRRPAKAILVGKSAVGLSAVRTVDREPLRRTNLALAASKSPETAYSVSFAHRVPRTLDDGIDLDEGHDLDSGFKNRKRI